MIHFIKEGEMGNIGLNIRTPKKLWPWPWVTFIWCWYDSRTWRESYVRFRIRTELYPWFIFHKKETYNVIENWMFERNYCVISRELAEDLNILDKVKKWE